MKCRFYRLSWSPVITHFCTDVTRWIRIFPFNAEVNQLDKHFPDGFTGEELEEGSGCPFNSNFYCLSVRNVAIAYPSVHLLDEFRSATEVIGDKETLQKKPLLNCHQQVRRSIHSLVVARDHPAQRKPRNGFADAKAASRWSPP